MVDFSFPGQLRAAQLLVNAGLSLSDDEVNASGFSIDTLKSAINQFGLMKTSLHSIFFSPPPVLLGFDTREVVLFCETSRLPGVGFATLEGHQRYGYGQTEKIPFLPIFNDINLGFIVDGAGIIENFFTTWMNSIINFNVEYGLTSTAFTGASPYEITYKKDYVTDINIYAHNESLDVITQYTLRDAFPISLADIDMNWGNQDSLARLPVAFSYKDWWKDSFASNILATLGPLAGLSSFNPFGTTGNSPIVAPSAISNILNTINASILIS